MLNPVPAFIEEIWNRQHFEKLGQLLHPDFKDHSLPPSFPTDKQGTEAWINATGLSFEHRTFIEEQVTEGDKTILKLRMELKHIGTWRDIPATGISVQVAGYRCFRLKDGKIAEHWALIDGQVIENALRDTSHGCRIAQ